MIILGLDCATRTGWAVGGHNTTGRSNPAAASIDSGVWDLKPGFDQSVGMRYIKLRGFLQETLKAYPNLEMIAYERAHMRGRAATEYALGYVATIQSIAEEHQLQVANVPTGTLKKFATGRGNADKSEMVLEAERRFGLTCTGKAREDEADAIWVLQWARIHYGTIERGGLDGSNSERRQQEGSEEGREEGREEETGSPGAPAPATASERVSGSTEGTRQDQRGDRRAARRAEAEDGLGRVRKRTPRRSPQSLAKGRVQNGEG